MENNKTLEKLYWKFTTRPQETIKKISGQLQSWGMRMASRRGRGHALLVAADLPTARISRLINPIDVKPAT